METQFYTRNAMTGWIFLIAFVLVFVGWPCYPSWSDAWSFLSNGQAGVALALLVAVLGSLVLGCGIGAWVRVLIRALYGHVYHGPSRESLLDGLNHGPNPRGLQPPPECLLPPRNKLDNLFALLFYTHAPEPLTLFCRRQHTGRFLGANCAWACVFGMVFAAAAQVVRSCHENDVCLTLGAGLGFLILVVLPQLLNGLCSHRDVERTERLWVWYVLHTPHPAQEGQPHSETHSPIEE